MTTMTTTTETAGRIWIGCLSCYNAGRLVGEWYPAEGADEITSEQVHADSGAALRFDCEELWGFDHEGIPVSGEISPCEAAEWGRVLAEVNEWQRDALLAWVRSGDYIAEGTGNLPSLSDFEERYAGEWDSFEQYAEELFIDCGYSAEIPDHLAAYFDMSAWARDLAYDYTTEPSGHGSVYVFRSL